MTKLLKTQLHQRPTYETLVKDTILEPKDKIALPDRQATILRKTQQLSRYDDSEFLDLGRDNENIAKEAAQQNTINAAAGVTQAEASHKHERFHLAGTKGALSRDHHHHQVEDKDSHHQHHQVEDKDRHHQHSHQQQEACHDLPWLEDKGSHHTHHYKHTQQLRDHRTRHQMELK